MPNIYDKFLDWAQPPAPPPPEPDPDCKHLRTTVRSHDLMMRGWCPECKSSVYLYEVLANMLKEMRKMVGLKEFGE